MEQGIVVALESMDVIQEQMFEPEPPSQPQIKPRFQVKILNFFPCRHTLLVFRVLKSESKGSFLEGTKLEPFSFFFRTFRFLL